MNGGLETIVLKMIARYSELIIMVVLILFGSATNATIGYRQAREQEKPFGFIDFCIAMFIAAFAGTVFALIAEVFLKMDGKALYVCASIGAFLGLSGLNRIVDSIIETLTKRIK